MTEITVAEYDDLRGDAVLRSKARDRVLRELEDGADAVLHLADWLVAEKDFETLENADQLVAGRVVAETEKAYLFTTTDDEDPDASAPGTDWVPKSQSRVYLPDDGVDGVDASGSPQRGLNDYA